MSRDRTGAGRTAGGGMALGAVALGRDGAVTVHLCGAASHGPHVSATGASAEQALGLAAAVLRVLRAARDVARDGPRWAGPPLDEAVCDLAVLLPDPDVTPAPPRHGAASVTVDGVAVTRDWLESAPASAVVARCAGQVAPGRGYAA
ncbi:hypothetical protein [Roseospira goensis]|uniref:Uncharacterized protein n=1 Tax=Roseospira goensis TaxID=391922 RepID=A0A7W6S1Y0_9PROT|nr:hypothetical protein [Roseospira goensis]MBB4287406.1 hypothetical protein [Roseospira goensis]